MPEAPGPLTSASIPPLGPEDRVRGEGEATIIYADLACPQCAAAWARLAEAGGALAFRHFPLASRRPRSPALHAAAEAAGAQGAFFEMLDSIYADQGHVDDPHLWQRVERLGLDLKRFDADRRSEAVAGRVRQDFESGIRAGITSTPTLFEVCTLRPVREREF